VKIGLLPTGVLRSQVDAADVVRWAADNGYESIDLPPDRRDAIELAGKLGVELGALGYLPGLITADPAARETAVKAAIERLRLIADVGGKLVGLGHGRVPETSDDENVEYFRLGVTPVAEVAGKLGVKMVMEPYPNFGKSLAICPAMWRKIFEAVPAPSLGLCYDPSHFVFMGIDWLRAVREFGDRIYYAHAKDTEIIPEGMYQYGFLAGPTFGRKPVNGPGWWRYCLPGTGAVHWGAYVSALREVGYNGAVAVEHEDDLWGWRDDVEKEKQGLIVARKYLSQFIA
jgi:sugar phosphate isomerase/epimerase